MSHATTMTDRAIMRIADIEIDERYADAFMKAARDVAEASVTREPGVICLLPMRLNDNPNHVRVVEVYRDSAAYQAHLLTPHFQTYKRITTPWVKSLVLHDGTQIAPDVTTSIFRKLPPTTAATALRRVITLEEHFILPDIARQILAELTKENDGKSPISETQRDLMRIVLPTNDDIADVGERRLRFMDEAGVDMQVLSYGAPSPQNLRDTAVAIRLCRAANDELARLIARHPTRFAGFAVLPATAPEAAADELERAVRRLGMKGAMLSGTCNGRFFDAPEFRVIFARAAKLGVPIYLHPATVSPEVARYYYADPRWSGVASAMFATAGYGWHVDSGIGILRLIFSGIFEELPDLQIISGHWGELVPFYLNRLDDQQNKTLNLPCKISDYFRTNIYITPSGFFSEAQLKYAVETVGVDRILYSADYPFLIDRDTRGFLERAPISSTDKNRIGYENAERLLKLR